MPKTLAGGRPELKPVNVGAAAIDIGSKMHWQRSTQGAPIRRCVRYIPHRGGVAVSACRHGSLPPEDCRLAHARSYAGRTRIRGTGDGHPAATSAGRIDPPLRSRCARRIQTVVATLIVFTMKVIRQALLPAFSSPVSFSVGR